MKNKKYDLGIKRFENVLSKEYTNIYALHGRGQCLYEKGIIEEAINSYDEALKNKPDFTNALNSKANAFLPVVFTSFYNVENVIDSSICRNIVGFVPCNVFNRMILV